MTSVAQVLKSVGPKLVPFFKTVAIYFVVFIPYTRPSILAMVLKCLPTFSLVIFILLNGMSTGKEYQYSRLIILGMLFGSIGDACLIWPGYFDLGLCSFLIGHLIYIYAFGFKPLQLRLGLVCFAGSVIGTLFFISDVSGPLLVGLPLYSTVIMAMVWRAAARVQFFEDLWTWSKLCTCAGALFFALSDVLVGIQYFKSDFPYAQLTIMLTYYAGQLGIALSVVDANLEGKQFTYSTTSAKTVKTN